MPGNRNKSIGFKKYDNAIKWITENWKDNKSVAALASQMEVLGRNMAALRSASDTESRKKARIVWQKAAQQYWDLVWAIVEAKIDAGPPEELEFSDAERLFIDFGHLYSEYTTPNPSFEEQITQPSAVDMYQYNRLTDSLKDNYSLIFGKPYSGPAGGVTLEEKLKRFNRELNASQARRRMAMNTLFNATDIIEKPELDGMLKNLEEGLRDAIETDMRTKRIREADNTARNIIKENCRNYEMSERSFWYTMDNLEKKLTKPDEPETPAAAAPEETAPVPGEPSKQPDAFDPFAEIAGSAANVPAPKPSAEAPAPMQTEPSDADGADYGDSIDDQPTADAPQQAADQGEALDQSLKIIQNVLSL
ncbi:MAG: hypothetical protein LBT08_02105, partial [Synergistaceae bacterium]|nr:hypothetical protein [Synergistaceae bacterium]